MRKAPESRGQQATEKKPCAAPHSKGRPAGHPYAHAIRYAAASPHHPSPPPPSPPPTGPPQQRAVVVMGRRVQQPRKICFYAESAHLEYTYSGLKLDTLAWGDGPVAQVLRAGNAQAPACR
jgi:hypothetical protein